MRASHCEVDLCGHGEVAPVVTAHAANFGGVRQCNRVKEVHEEQASLWMRGIGLRRQGDDEFDWRGELVGGRANRGKREGTDGLV